MSDWFLGGVTDEAGERTDERLLFDSDNLTTHGVIVGMTGSGKTGLGIIALEEAVRSGVPVLVLDPKGDMGNLLLQFPGLAADDFAPWIEEGDAQSVAETWKSGLESWGLGGDDLAALRGGADYTIYTPGSSAGVPLNVLGSLAAPADLVDAATEDVTAEIDGWVSGLLGLVDVESDPLSSPEHILIANLISRSWEKGTPLSLETLIGQVVTPPLRKLGVFEVDTFFPKKDRMALAMRLNGLVAKPGFEVWLTGQSVDIGSLLWTSDGKPRAAIVALAHLSEAERQFVVTLVLNKLVTWMRTQAGSSKLRALVYMDEVFGFAPPTKAPPSKQPILTILKQARAFGIGMILATQNPVDLDYKAMSNAGTWMVGRLQTERDKARILEALQSATGEVDTKALDRSLSSMHKRQFLLHSPQRKPTLFTTRWAMSYLRGPLTRAQITQLTGDAPTLTPTAPAPAPTPTPTTQMTPATTAPAVADGVPVYYVDPAAPWREELGVDGDGPKHTAGIAVRCQLLFDESRAGVEHREEWEAILWPLTGSMDPGDAKAVDYDTRDFLPEVPDKIEFELPEVSLDKKSLFTKAASDIRNWLDDHRTIEVLRNKELELCSRVGESREDFAGRCDRIAQLKADQETAKMRSKFESKLKSARSALESAESRLESAKERQRASKSQEVTSGLDSLLGAILGGRGTTRRVASGVSRAASQRAKSREAKVKVGTAEDKVQEKHAELYELEIEATEELKAIDEKWKKTADAIESLEIGLEKDDIRVEETALVWIPS